VKLRGGGGGAEGDRQTEQSPAHTGGWAMAYGVDQERRNRDRDVDVLFDVVWPNNLRECDVHPSQVKCTSQPLVAFRPLNDLNKRLLRADLSGAAGGVYTGDSSTAFSTAHLFRSLQLCTSTITTDRLRASAKHAKVLRELPELAGQVSWLIAANIAHHAHHPIGDGEREADRAAAMAHQLRELRHTMRIPSYAGLSGKGRDGSSSQSTGSAATGFGIVPPGSISSAGGGGGGNDWMQTEEWGSYCDWVSRWVEEVLYRGLGQMRHHMDTEQRPLLLTEEQPELTPKNRKKRIGLRAKVEWVHSPDDL
jgi:hypothetical protein